MRFKLFLASLLACGFIAYVIANENVSTETESVSANTKDKKGVGSTVLDKNEAVEMIEILPPQPKQKQQHQHTAPKVSSTTGTLVANMSQQRSGALQMADFYLGELGYDIVNDNGYNWDPNNRMAPPTMPSHSLTGGYTITPQRLAEIRSYFMYWYFDQDMYGGRGDYQFDIHASTTQIHKNLNFQLPFYGFRFNYTRVSLNGYLEFSDPPEYFTYPLVFPVKDWPKKNDPSFIGIFFSKCRVGRIYPTDIDQRTPGVYFRMERDLMTRTDRFGVEVRERTMWDIRDGVVGAETFVPKHVVITTWKNVSFAGGIDNSLFTTNTFQMVLATDEVYTYAIFNYDVLNWSAHTEAGGDTTHGEGGVPAFVGFNAGNGTRSYEYKPYSQNMVIRDLTGRGWGNGFPGRHIFRLDEEILIGSCNKDIDAAILPLTFAPESGNMLGGTVVNITGPCFDPNIRVMCHFDTEDVLGQYVDKNRVICVQPYLKAEGYIRFEISVGNERFKWRGKYFVETPAAATEKIFFETDDVHKKAPKEIRINWNAYNLTSNANANIMISLWGYRETTIHPQLEYIDVIEAASSNTGHYIISPQNYVNRNNINNDLQFGFIQINLTDPQQYNNLKISPLLWSRPIPLAWYFKPQWERKFGYKWPRALCDNWIRNDRFLRNFAADLPLCPCTLEQAVYDKGRYRPDRDCDKDSNPTCLRHKTAIHCVVSGTPTAQGAEQQCCYDRYGFLMLSQDQVWGSRPRRIHNLGKMPWNEASKVPTLSTWFHDMRPFYSCCYWQEEQAVGCETYRFERRPSQDCVAYQAPGVAGVFGDPHFITFDGTQYTFNGLGEFVLSRSVDADQRFEVQGRFEQVPNNVYGAVPATQLTALAMRGNTTTTIEVRIRPKHARWRYKMDVLADGRRVYFDRESLKFQHFDGVTVYTPTYLLNQSQVVVMFDSGIGVEVIENEGYMTGRVYLPWNFINKTAGLFGNWSFNPMDDFTLPNGQVLNINPSDFKTVHNQWAMNWMLADRDLPGVGAALFTREFGRTASYFANSSFVPNYVQEPANFLPANRSYDVEKAEDLCGESYQCRYDYGMTLNRDLAVAYIVNEITNLIIPRRAPIYPPIENPLLLKSVNELLTDLKGRKITSYEIVTTYIDRIKEVNARLNAVIENRYMEAIKEARHADNLISQAKDEFQLLMLFSRYPLLGIPFTVKEACGVKGLSYSVGSVARKDEKSPENGDAVEQMRAAGAIPLLVSANPEFCLAFDGETIVYGKCLNPYDMRRSSGGSSSGEGTLNGAGASTFGLASDISGSIRLPSLFCGVFGHKPTGGLISVKGHYPYSTKEEDFPYYLQMGPITRFAKDLPLLLQVMAGENAKKLKLTEEIDFQKLKIYYSYSMGNFLHVPVDFEIKLAITRAVKCFEKGGIATEELHLKEFQNAIEICLSSLASIKGLPSIVTQSVENKPNKLQIIQKIAQSLFGLVPYTTMPLFVELMILVNAFIPSKESARWKEEVKQLRTKLGNLLGTNGVLILPTYHKTANFFNGCSFLNISGTIFMLLFNVLGFPATHVPMGLDRRGLPVGFQVVAAPYMDKLCLQVAAEMEAAFGGWVQPQK